VARFCPDFSRPLEGIGPLLEIYEWRPLRRTSSTECRHRLFGGLHSGRLHLPSGCSGGDVRARSLHVIDPAFLVHRAFQEGIGPEIKDRGPWCVPTGPCRVGLRGAAKPSCVNSRRRARLEDDLAGAQLVTGSHVAGQDPLWDRPTRAEYGDYGGHCVVTSVGLLLGSDEACRWSAIKRISQSCNLCAPSRHIVNGKEYREVIETPRAENSVSPAARPGNALSAIGLLSPGRTCAGGHGRASVETEANHE
jgi:hypothetical protein